MKDICFIKEPESGGWTLQPMVGVAGNYSLERFLAEIQTELDTKNESFYSSYLWSAKGEKYSREDDQLLDTCDRWHLSRYEVYPAPDETKYQAIVILYYAPAVKVAIAV